MRSHFEIVTTDAEQPHLVRWFGDNGEEVFKSSENYVDEAGAERAVCIAAETGVELLGDNVEQLPQGQALIDYWRSKFGLTEQRVLDAVLAVYPHETSQAAVAEATGYSPTASTIGVALGRLRKVGVIDRWRISDDFAQAAGLA